MSPRRRKRVLIVLAALVLSLMVAGVAAAWLSRNDTICGDGKPPTAQRAVGLGQIEYRCHDGTYVRK